MTPRQRLALGALAMLAGVTALAAPGVGRAATVSCPELSLLSEELAESPSVFVGVMQAPFDTDLIRGATFVVEERWRGPDLAPVVRVTVEDAAGAPTLKLASGVRYLVAARPSPDATSAGAPVSSLIVPACSVTRPWAPELADLRPPDARPIGDTAPTPTATAQSPVPGWLWAGSGMLLLAALGVAFVAVSRRRTLLPSAAVLGVAGIALLGGTIAMSLAPRAADVDPTTSPDASTPLPRQESLTPDGRLVVRLEVLRDETRISVVSIHADGRLISASSDTGTASLSERRLSADGLGLVLQAMEAAGLPDGDIPDTLGGDAASGEIIERLTYAGEDGIRSVRWTPIDPGGVDGSTDAEAIVRLETLVEQLLAPDDWLPASAWVTAERSDYRAETFHVLVSPIPFGSFRPALDVATLAEPFPSSLTALDPMAAVPGCVQLARSQATELLGAIAERLDRVDLTPAAASTDIAADDTERSVSYRLSLRPRLPDEGGCPGEPPAEPTEAGLAPGVIALVRVDALRVRSGAGSSFEAIDSFAAGERVEVVAGPVAADNMDWYEVRQGPSGRGGHVARGPADGDPWLVPISNGAIVFMEGVGSDGTLSIGRMNADGSAVATLLDGGAPVWSPDGKRFAFTVPPQPDGTWQLATAEADGSQVTRLGEGEYPAWSPDGARLAFARGGEIWVMNADGTEQRLLVASASPWSVAWDPDGSRLAYMAPEALEAPETGGEGMMAPNPEALWFVDIASGELTQVTPAEVLGSGTTPAWSPDGTRLAIGGNRMIDESGALVLRLEEGVIWGPWSPSGDELALLINGSIEILDLDSGERRRIARTGLANQLIWSPVGSHLAFTASRAGSDEWQIHVVEAVGGEQAALGPSFSQFPAWQPVVPQGLD